MGNSSSSSVRAHAEESVDYGHFTSQGVYTGPNDWNHPIVAQLIAQRKLAPFYRPLEDYDESWTDDQILAARKELPDSDSTSDFGSSPRTEHPTPNGHKSASLSKKPGGTLKEPTKPEAAIYRGAVECPICFLYYPPNINHSRCCDQAICTECFVQIKRAEPTATHLVSEAASCPYCVQENFGVVYNPPARRAGIGSEASPWGDLAKENNVPNNVPYPTHKRRQKSFSADSPDVVTTDQIRPDWEEKLAAVRATVARRANRRIIMRQVGDRLIPVGVTSGRVLPLNPEDGGADPNEPNGSRRSRRRAQQQNQELNQYMGTMGLGGHDLEELMIMEAMRLSMLDHEEQQRKEAEAKAKTEKETGNNNGGDPSGTRPSTSPQAIANSRTDPSKSKFIAGLDHPSTTLHPPSVNDQHTLSTSAPSSRSADSMPTIHHSLSDTMRSWRRRSLSPPAFSAVRAAMDVANTASAVFVQDEDNRTAKGEDVRERSLTPQGSGWRPASGPSRASAEEPSHADTGQHDTNDNAAAGSSLRLPAGPSRMSSFTSSLFSTASREPGDPYETLISSPDSSFQHPLLGLERRDSNRSTSVLEGPSLAGGYSVTSDVQPKKN